MSLQLLKKVSVLIITKERHSDKSIQGSGVIIKHSDKCYVLTAEHCINGKEGDRLIGILPKDINVDFNGRKLKVTSIIETNEIDDYAILELEHVENHNHSIIYSTNWEAENFQLYGFPEIIKGQGRLFRCNLANKVGNTITISCDVFHKDSSYENAIGNVHGLSGSGVFIVDDESKVLTLVGIVKNVRGENVVYGDMVCNDISFLPQFIDGIELSSFDFANEIEEERKLIEEIITEEAIENWRKKNNTSFNRISNKCQLLYSEEELDRKIFNYINQYLIGVQYLDNIYTDSPKLNEKIRNYIHEFKFAVGNEYSKIIEEQDEGIKIIKRLRKKLNKNFKNFDIPRTKIDTLKNYSIAEYLRECSLYFK